MKICSCCKRIYANEKDFMRNTSRWRVSERGDLYFNCSCKSTLVIPKGKHDWYNPALYMSAAAASIFNRFADRGRFPLLSEVALEAQRIVSDDTKNVTEIVDCIKLDPMISLWVLEIGDQSRPLASGPIKSLTQAVGVLGRDRVKELITLAAVAKFSVQTKFYTRENYFRSSMLTALIAQEFASSWGSQESHDLAFVAGSLCNMGKLLGSIVCPDEIDSVYKLTQSMTPTYTWIQAEQKIDATSHLLLGEIAATLWGVPREVIECIENHHTAFEAGSFKKSQTEMTLLEIVTFANETSKHVAHESHLSEPKVKEACLKRFKKSSDQFNEMVSNFQKKLLPQLEKTTALLLGKSSAT